MDTAFATVHGTDSCVAAAQLAASSKALERSRGDTLRLRGYAVVALGFERLLVRPQS